MCCWGLCHTVDLCGKGNASCGAHKHYEDWLTALFFLFWWELGSSSSIPTKAAFWTSVPAAANRDTTVTMKPTAQVIRSSRAVMGVTLENRNKNVRALSVLFGLDATSNQYQASSYRSGLQYMQYLLYALVGKSGLKKGWLNFCNTVMPPSAARTTWGINLLATGCMQCQCPA